MLIAIRPFKRGLYILAAGVLIWIMLAAGLSCTGEARQQNLDPGF